MGAINYQIILTEPNGNFAIPDIIITDDFSTLFSIQNAADISQRKDTISKGVTFPGTDNNNNIFNNLWSFNRNSDSDLDESLFYNYAPTRGVTAVIYENNIPVFKGMLFMTKTKKEVGKTYTYTGIVKGNLVSFFQRLADKNLTDLAGFTASYTYSVSEIKASWDFLDTKLMVWGMLDYGKGIVQNRAKFDLRNIRPGIYVRQYIKQILASQGYTYLSTFIDSDKFKRAYIPHNEKEFGKTIFGTVSSATGAGRSVDILRGDFKLAYESFYWSALTDTTYVNKISGVGLTDDATPGEDYDTTKVGEVFQFSRFTNTGATISFDINVTSQATETRVYIKIVALNDANHFDSSKAVQTVTRSYIGSTGVTKNLTGQIQLPVADYNKAYKFAVIAQIESYPNADDVDYTQNNPMSITFTNPDAATGSTFNYELGESVTLSEMVPKNQLAVDFLKSILQLFNLYLIENPANPKQLIIEPYDIFYSQTKAPRAYALDWSKKINATDLETDIQTQLPKSYVFKFKTDSDYYNNLYQNTWNDTYGNFTALNPKGSADPKTVDVTFSPTVVVKESVEDKTFPALFAGDLTAKESMKTNLRILFNNGSANCQSYDWGYAISDGNGNISYDDKELAVTTYCVSHHVLRLAGVGIYNVLFGLPKAVYYDVSDDVFNLPDLYTVGYANQLAELNDDNLFTLIAKANITEYDVANIDLRTPIFIATYEGAAYFKIMTLEYYNNEELSPVTLQKIVL